MIPTSSWKYACILFLLTGLMGCSSSTGESAAGTLDRWMAGLRGRSSEGKSELDRAFAAKKNATSWRMRTVIAMHPGQVMETEIAVSCPDREHITTRVADTTLEAIHVGKDFYTRDQQGRWTKAESAHAEWSPCGESPGDPSPWAMMNEGREMTTVLDSLAGKAEVKRGAVIQIAGGECQQWTLTMAHPGGGGKPVTYVACIGANDHLMRTVDVGSGKMTTTYSDWNTPIRVAAPM